MRFSEERYDSFSDAPQASSAEAFGTQGVNFWAIKPMAGQRRQAPRVAWAGAPKIIPNPLAALPDPDEVYDAGALGCADGPLVHIAASLKRLPPGAVLEVRSTDPGVIADLPAWCRMTGHTFLGGGQDEYRGRFFVRRKDD